MEKAGELWSRRELTRGKPFACRMDPAAKPPLITAFVLLALRYRQVNLLLNAVPAMRINPA